MGEMKLKEGGWVGAGKLHSDLKFEGGVAKEIHFYWRMEGMDMWIYASMFKGSLWEQEKWRVGGMSAEINAD